MPERTGLIEDYCGALMSLTDGFRTLTIDPNTKVANALYKLAIAYGVPSDITIGEFVDVWNSNVAEGWNFVPNGGIPYESIR